MYSFILALESWPEGHNASADVVDREMPGTSWSVPSISFALPLLAKWQKGHLAPLQHYIIGNIFPGKKVLNDIVLSITSLCSASYISWQSGTLHICCCAPCWNMAAADQRLTNHAAIAQQLLATGLTAANPPQQWAAAGWDRRTDRRTPERCTDSTPHTMWAVSTIRLINKPEKWHRWHQDMLLCHEVCHFNSSYGI